MNRRTNTSRYGLITAVPAVEPRRPRVTVRALRGIDYTTVPPMPTTCDLCHQPFGTSIETRITLDHDHTTRQFRGWIHQRCNRLLVAGADKATMRLVVAYLGRTQPDYLDAFNARQQRILEQRNAVYSQTEPIRWDTSEREWLAAIEARVLRIRYHTKTYEVAMDSLVDLGNYAALMFDHIRKKGKIAMTSEEYQHDSTRRPRGMTTSAAPEDR